MRKIKVIFIHGSGRCGSTLLEKLIGNINGLFPIGELGRFWEKAILGGILCNCKKPALECSFWSNVIKEGVEKGGEDYRKEMSNTEKKVIKICFFPFLVLPSMESEDYSKKVNEYVKYLTRIYSSISKFSKNKIIIDSSKNIMYMKILSTLPQIELYVINLIRDSRAVVYSWQRKKFHPDDIRGEKYMLKWNILPASRRWLQEYALFPYIKRRCKTYTTLRYEDLIANPKKELSRVMDELGFNITKKDLSFIKEDKTVKFKQFHTIWGNPMKFQKGPIKLKLDDEWKTKMPWYKKAIVTALTFPLLLKYKYI